GAPSRGNDVNARGTSLGFRCFRARVRLDQWLVRLNIHEESLAHLYRMSPSTESRSRIDPVYGAPGVDSSMYRPYSGWNVGGVTLQRIASAAAHSKEGDRRTYPDS